MSDPLENLLPESARPETAPRAVCQRCFEFMDVGDNFCRYCGGMTEHGAALAKIGRLPLPAGHEIPVKPPRWTESPVVVLLALFFFLGPLALPMLWWSRRFTRGWKIGLTIAVLLATVAACWYSWNVVQAWNKALDQALRQAGLA